MTTKDRILQQSGSARQHYAFLSSRVLGKTSGDKSLANCFHITDSSAICQQMPGSFLRSGVIQSRVAHLSDYIYIYVSKAVLKYSLADRFEYFNNPVSRCLKMVRSVKTTTHWIEIPYLWVPRRSYKHGKVETVDFGFSHTILII